MENHKIKGLTHEHNGQLLGNYTYSINDENNIQHFKVQAVYFIIYKKKLIYFKRFLNQIKLFL